MSGSCKPTVDQTRRSTGATGAGLVLALVLGSLLAAPPGATGGGRALLPLRFEPRAVAEDAWVARLPGYRLDVSAGAADIVTPEGSVRMRIVGADAGARSAGEEEHAARSHYLLGRDPQAWRTQVPAYSRVRFAAVRPGVDVVYYGTDGALEFDFVAAPGSEPAALELAFDGVRRLEVDADGSLLVEYGAGRFALRPPVAFQDGPQGREPVAARYALRSDESVGFSLGRFDPARPLVIDPVLSYSTYLGGGSDDAVRAVAVDRLGYAYVTGDTLSLDFPTAAALQPGYGGGVHDAFVAKLTPDGNDLVWATYLGGTLHDRGFALAVDSYGHVTLTGRTGSLDFPLVAPLQPAFGGGDNDAFVTQLTPGGDAIVFSTYLGGGGDDRGLGIAQDRRGDVVVAGLTLSADFPLANALQTQLLGTVDAFVAKLGSTGAALVYSTYLGGSGVDNARAVAVDAGGRVAVAGDTASADFPVVDPLQPLHGGSSDAWVGWLDESGQNLGPVTFLGGSGDDFGLALGLSPSGEVVVAGSTTSVDFPVVNAFQPALAGQTDAFVARIDPTGAALVHASYLGGAVTDFALALGVGADGIAGIAGNTGSADFPVTGAVQPQKAGGFDNFGARVSPTGVLLDSTFLGGSADDLGFDRMGAAIGPDGALFIAGRTRSSDFPTQRAVQATSGGGLSDGFVARIGVGPEVFLRLSDVGGVPQVALEIANGAPGEVRVELRLWLDGDAFAVPLGLTPAGTVLALPPLPPTQVVSFPLGGNPTFPGTEVGARLTDPDTGEILSESLCVELPCNL